MNAAHNNNLNSHTHEKKRSRFLVSSAGTSSLQTKKNTGVQLQTQNFQTHKENPPPPICTFHVLLLLLLLLQAFLSFFCSSSALGISNKREEGKQERKKERKKPKKKSVANFLFIHL
jgi:hypothetical protein